MRRPAYSRLTKKQEIRSLRRAVIFGFLSLILIFTIIFFGIPVLTKMAVFLGNLRGSYLPTETEDKLPPSPPRLNPLAEATSSAQIDLSGFAEPASIVEILVSGISQEKVVTESDSTFLLHNLKLTEGRNEIYATATDKAGNTSQPSEKTTIILDNTPVELTITQPANETTFYKPVKKIEIKGETEEGAILTINGHFVIVDTQGKFSYPLILNQGENKIQIVATDRAGNKTEREVTIKLE